MNTLERNKEIAHTIAAIFGGEPHVFCYRDENNSTSIDILSCRDRPDEGITSYSTIGLSQYDQNLYSNNKPIRVEIIGSCDSTIEHFPNIIANCAIHIMKNHMRCYPGLLLRNVVDTKFLETDLKNAIFVSPFIWEHELRTISKDDMYVCWLLMVLISDSEYQYAEQNGSDSLENLFEEKSIDIYDIYRESVI